MSRVGLKRARKTACRDRVRSGLAPPEDGGTATARLGRVAGGRKKSIKTEFQTCVICLIHKAVKTTLEEKGEEEEGAEGVKKEG